MNLFSRPSSTIALAPDPHGSETPKHTQSGKDEMTTTPAPAIDLPAGHAVPEDAMFVPERLREFYPLTVARSALDLTDHAQMLARSRAHDQAERELGGPAVPARMSNDEVYRLRAHLSERVQELTPEIERVHGAELLAIAQHHDRLGQAHELAVAAEEAYLTKVRYEREFTCPVCGECAPEVNGWVRRRSLNPDVPIPALSFEEPKMPTLRSCAACFVVGHREYVEQVAGVTLLEKLGQSRLVAVRNQMAADARAAKDGK